uniref:MORN repeat-containing protein 5 n=1 Tax=Craspedostauros australis TaxID=1486917 RepID=A0A7R9WQ20_9STRA
MPEGQQELESKTLLLSLDIMQRPIEPQDLDDDRIMVNDMEYDDDETGLRMKYSGMLSEESGKPCGHGKLQYLDRPSQQKRNPKHLKDLAKNHDFQLRWYKGQFVHGVKNGFGQSCYWSGATYKGFFSQNMKNGHGTLDFPDGRRFEGLFEKNVKLEGTMMYEDGSTYSGKFAHGVRHGSNGTYRFGNSALVYVGDFRKDQIEGQGTLTWPNGGKYVGAWKNGVRHGHGTEYRADGSLMRSGKWENGSLIEPEKFDEEPDAQSYEYDEAESNYDSDSDEESYELRPSDI